MTTRYDLVDPDALKWLATTLGEGAARGYHDTDPPKWRTQDILEHLGHVHAHMMMWARENTDEDHLAHMFCRLMFCLRLHQEATSSSSVDPSQATPEPGPTNLP